MTNPVDAPHFRRVQVPDFSRFTREQVEAMRLASERAIDKLSAYYAEWYAHTEAWLVSTLAAAGLTLNDAPRCRLVTQEVERLPGRWVDLLTLEVDGRAIGEPLRLVVEFGAELVHAADGCRA